MQSYLLVVCIVVFHDLVWIIATLLYDLNEQNGHLIGLQNVANQRRAKGPNLATTIRDRQIGPRPA